MGSASRGLRNCSGSRDSVRGRRGGGGAVCCVRGGGGALPRLYFCQRFMNVQMGGWLRGLAASGTFGRFYIDEF